jgi:hypothetical protein
MGKCGKREEDGKEIDNPKRQGYYIGQDKTR